VNELLKDGIFKKIIIGRSYLCSINLRNDKAVYLLILNEIKKKEKFLKKNKKFSEIIPILEKIKSGFKVYTTLALNDSLIFVLDYINDKDAIINKYPAIKKLNPVFYDRDSFCDTLIKDDTLVEDKVILYAYETYFELVESVEDKLRLKRNKLFK